MNVIQRLSSFLPLLPSVQVRSCRLWSLTGVGAHPERHKMKNNTKITTAIAGLASVIALSNSAAAEHDPHVDTEQPPSMVLFDGQDFSGPSVYIDGTVKDLGSYGFNDRAISIDFTGYQPGWLLCKHHSFQGPCVVVREPTYHLQKFGLGDEITSVAPLSLDNPFPHGTIFEENSWGELTFFEVDYYGNLRTTYSESDVRYSYYSVRPNVSRVSLNYYFDFGRSSRYFHRGGSGYRYNPSIRPAYHRAASQRFLNRLQRQARENRRSIQEEERAREARRERRREIRQSERRQREREDYRREHRRDVAERDQRNRDREARENRQRDVAEREQRNRDQEARQNRQRDVAEREQRNRDRDARQNRQRDVAEREQRNRDRDARENRQRDVAERDQRNRQQVARENRQREQADRENRQRRMLAEANNRSRSHNDHPRAGGNRNADRVQPVRETRNNSSNEQRPVANNDRKSKDSWHPRAGGNKRNDN